jgi:uncharacterized protein (UPF0332 family)
LRHAGVAIRAAHEFVDSATDLPDLNEGEAGKKDKEAQDQRETAQYAGTDADLGQQQRKLHGNPADFKEWI